MRSRRLTATWIASAGFVAIALLQLDFWRPQRGRIWLGWMPEELAYRLTLLLLAWLLMMFICSFVWDSHAD